MSALKAILLILAALLVIGLGLMYAGVIDVGADAKDSALTQWLLSNTRIRSIAHGARGVQPVALDDPQLIAMGADHYAEMCVPCHLAPGLKDSELRVGLNPRPPDLTQGTGPLRDAEIFWIIKHGIRMTGMPAWGATHSDNMIWALVAFLKKLPTLTPEQYEALTRTETDDHPHAHDEGPPQIQ